MANGKQLSDQNVSIFTSWVAGKTDADFRQMVSRGVLSRKEIAAECGFAKSALDQNPRIKSALAELEQGLRERGVLPPLFEKRPDEPAPLRLGHQKAAAEAERLNRLEQENASMRAENDELKRRLARYEVLHEALALTGRVPR